MWVALALWSRVNLIMGKADLGCLQRLSMCKYHWIYRHSLSGCSGGSAWAYASLLCGTGRGQGVGLQTQSIGVWLGKGSDIQQSWIHAWLIE
jgi:hypothetical protein